MLTGSDCCSTTKSSDRSTVGSDLIGSTTNCCCSLSYLPGSMTLDQVLCLKGFYVKKWTCEYSI